MTTPAVAAPTGQAEGGIEQPGTKRGTRQSAGTPPQAAGMMWLGGWLFTVGFAKLAWWKAILGLLLSPYFLGLSLR